MIAQPADSERAREKEEMHMGNLRVDLRKYESENKVKVKASYWPHFRCLRCPISFFGCGLAKKSLKPKKA
jgi:hypothetical protein